MALHLPWGRVVNGAQITAVPRRGACAGDAGIWDDADRALALRRKHSHQRVRADGIRFLFMFLRLAIFHQACSAVLRGDMAIGGDNSKPRIKRCCGFALSRRTFIT